MRRTTKIDDRPAPPKSEETKRKISEGAKRAWERKRAAAAAGQL